MNKKIIMLSFLIVLFISITIYTYINYFKLASMLVDVPVSNRTIDAREKILKQDIKYIKFPRNFIPENIILNEEDIIGKYNSINNQISRNSFFYQGEIELIEESVDYPLTLMKDNQIFYSLNENDIDSSLNILSTYQMVDIYLSLENQNVVESDLLIKNVKIIALYDLKGERIKKTNNKQKVFQIALALDENLISILNKAKAKGKISLFINNSKSKQESVLNSESIILSYLD